MSGDKLLPFVLEGAAVRGACVRMDEAARAALASHDYPPALARVLSELLAAATLLAASLKFRGALAVQLAGPGPVRLAVVECDHALSFRATAQWDRAAFDRLPVDATLADLAGDAKNARLVISLDPEDGPLYQGIVAIEAGSVASLVEHYLATSEQIESRLAIVAGEHGVAGMLVQRLPGASDADRVAWAEASEALAARAADALATTNDPGAALAATFVERDLRVFASRTPRFMCRCSEARVDQALRIAGREEVEAAIRDGGKVEIVCEYCGRRYAYGAERARALFDSGAPITRH
ncbi:MAG: hypothetical protein AMXMBFR42_28330 [Burkholderiales bacterium]